MRTEFVIEMNQKIIFKNMFKYIHDYNIRLKKNAHARFYHGLMFADRGALEPMEKPNFNDPALLVTDNYNGSHESFLQWN